MLCMQYMTLYLNDIRGNELVSEQQSDSAAALMLFVAYAVKGKSNELAADTSVHVFIKVLHESSKFKLLIPPLTGNS